MKVVAVPERPLGRVPLDSALRSVFGEAVLRRVHGPSLRFQPSPAFDADGQRAFEFSVPVDRVPAAMRAFFCGDRLRVSTRQTLTAAPGRLHVTNALRLHFVGSELFRIRPEFWLRTDASGSVALGGEVRHDALLPPPLKGLAEGFMCRHTRRELERFGAEVGHPSPPRHHHDT
jgi:hypothetical protein